MNIYNQERLAWNGKIARVVKRLNLHGGIMYMEYLHAGVNKNIGKGPRKIPGPNPMRKREKV